MDPSQDPNPALDWPLYLKMEGYTHEDRFLLIDDGAEQYDLWRVIGVHRGCFATDTMLTFDSGTKALVGLEFELVSQVWREALVRRERGRP